MHATSPRIRGRRAKPVLAAVLIAGSSMQVGCEGAFYGGAAGAYGVMGGYTGGDDRYVPRGGLTSDSCNGDIILLGAVVIGAGIGAIAEIIQWICGGGR